MKFNIKKYSRLLEKMYDPYNYMKKRHPKAAKRRRIQKKWRKRFGPSLHDLVKQDYFDIQMFGIPKPFEPIPYVTFGELN